MRGRDSNQTVVNVLTRIIIKMQIMFSLWKEIEFLQSLFKSFRNFLYSNRRILLYLYLSIECILIVCRETETKAITITNQRKIIFQRANKNSRNCFKGGKTWVGQLRLVLFLNLIGWECGGSFWTNHESK